MVRYTTHWLAYSLLQETYDHTQKDDVNFIFRLVSFQGGQYILFSVVFTHSAPSHHHGSVWLLPVISLLLTNTIDGAGMPVHMIGEVSWEPKKRQAWAS